jgi:hypothetical protein
MRFSRLAFVLVSSLGLVSCAPEGTQRAPSTAPVVPTGKPVASALPLPAAAPTTLTLDELVRAIATQEPEDLGRLTPKASRDTFDAKHGTFANDAARIAAYEASPRDSMSFSSSSPESIVRGIYAVFEALRTLEPVALRKDDSATTLSAVCSMNQVLGAAARARDLARLANRLEVPEAVRDYVKENDAWLARADDMRKRYVALAARRSPPGLGCRYAALREGLDIAALTKEQRSDALRRIDAELTRDESRARPVDRLEVASMHLGADDPGGAEKWLTSARASLATARNADQEARLVRLERNLVLTKKLAETPARELFARADLLAELDRKREARALLEASEPKASRSPRVAGRLALIAFQESAMQNDLETALAEAASEVALAKEGPHDETFASVSLGLEGARLVSAMSRGTLLRDLAFAKPRLVAMTDDLAKWNPGRAAAIRLFVDSFGTCEDALAKGDLGCLFRVLPELLPEARRLREKYPEVEDLDRAVLFVSMFATDRALAVSEVVKKPSASALASREISLDRVRTAVTLASREALPEARARLRKTLDDVPSRGAGVRDRDRELLEADFLLVEAVHRPSKATRESAARAYVRALAEDAGTRAAKGSESPFRESDAPKTDRAFAREPAGMRAVHALAYLTAMENKKPEARAMLTGLDSPPEWPWVLNRATLDDSPKAALEAVKAAKKSGGDGAKATLSVWEAFWATERHEKSEAARAALEGQRTPMYGVKREAAERGLEWVGRMNLSLGIAPRGHYFAASSSADLWPLPKPPLSHAELERLAGARK